VRLKDGERWEYQPPAGHNVAWMYSLTRKELVVFEEGETALSFEGETEFVLGSAVKHPHDLVLGYYSVHTSAQALETGEAKIAEIGRQLKAAGRI
jgi:hypothetical protein